MNKICAILPYYGEFHPFFNLFLHSVGRNRNILDLLLVTDEPVAFDVPGNVKLLYLSKEELSGKVSKCIKEWFGVEVSSCFPEKAGSRTGMYKLCDYRIFYQDLFKEFLNKYEYWGFVDADTVLGDIKNLLFDLDHYDVVGHKGHMCFLRNNETYKKIMLDFNYWGDLKGYPQREHGKALLQITDITKNHIFDEGWMQGNLHVFNSNRRDFNLLRTYTPSRPMMCDIYSPKESPEKYLDNLWVRDFDKEDSLEKNYKKQYFEYRDGKLFRNSEEKTRETEHLYVHLIHRQHIIKNNIIIKNFSDPLNFQINSKEFKLI